MRKQIVGVFQEQIKLNVSSILETSLAHGIIGVLTLAGPRQQIVGALQARLHAETPQGADGGNVNKRDAGNIMLAELAMQEEIGEVIIAHGAAPAITVKKKVVMIL